MGRNRKLFFHGTVVEVGSRVEEGLPFVATSYMKLIIESYLARAQTFYPVRLLNYVFMANHFHMQILVENPQAVSGFVGYFKRETAYAVNSLLGREKHTVWGEGFDSPTVLDAAKLLERLTYFYTNPQRARLESTIERYPQVNSWKEFLDETPTRRMVPTFGRPAIPRIDGLSERQIYELILSEQDGQAELHIEPFAWLSAFPDMIRTPPKAIVDEVMRRVRESEARLEKVKGKEVLGAEALRTQNIRQPHQPKKRGKRMICLGSIREQRTAFIAWFKETSEIARSAIHDWMRSAAPLRLPPGFFAPGGHLQANAFPAAFGF